MREPPLSANKLSRVVATEEVTDDTAVMRHIMRLTRKTFARSQAFEEVVDVIDVSQPLADSWKHQDSLLALWIFRRDVTLKLVSSKMLTRVAAIFPVNKYYFSLVLASLICTSPLNQKLATSGIFLYVKCQVLM